jgi:hypothetical protein
MQMQRIEGLVMVGHGVASGRSVGSSANPYPQGSIAMQAHFFKAQGLDLSDCYLGTINLNIAPKHWQLLQADHRFEKMWWTDLHPPETFSFVRVQALWPDKNQETKQDKNLRGWLYYPHPETKAQHHQAPSVMELILPRLEGLQVGQRLAIEVSAQAIRLSNGLSNELSDPA